MDKVGWIMENATPTVTGRRLPGNYPVALPPSSLEAGRVIKQLSLQEPLGRPVVKGASGRRASKKRGSIGIDGDGGVSPCRFTMDLGQ